jgi:hypothetical protein
MSRRRSQVRLQVRSCCHSAPVPVASELRRHEVLAAGEADEARSWHPHRMLANLPRSWVVRMVPQLICSYTTSWDSTSWNSAPVGWLEQVRRALEMRPYS